MDTPQPNGALARLKEWAAVAKDLGMPWLFALLALGLFAGLIPSGAYSNAEALKLHQAVFDTHVEQSRDVLRLMRAICRNTAKSDVARDQCDR